MGPRPCREISEPANREAREFARKIHEALKGAERKRPATAAPITSHLNRILLGLGYEASLVEMLGRKYGG